MLRLDPRTAYSPHQRFGNTRKLINMVNTRITKASLFDENRRVPGMDPGESSQEVDSILAVVPR